MMRDQTENTRETDNEIENHSEEELDKVVEANLRDESLVWPDIADEEEKISIYSVICVLLNLSLVPTAYTVLLERGETRAGLLCHRFLKERANEILTTIWETQKAMGGGSSKQSNEGETVIGEQVGVDLTSNYSLLDMRGWHSSTIGLCIMIIIIILGLMICARKRYKSLQKEVMMHRDRRLREKSHSVKMNDFEILDRPELQTNENETTINKTALNRLRMAAANGGVE